MYYAYLPMVAEHISRTHRTFAGRVATRSNALSALGRAHGRMLMKDTCDATFRARTDEEHGNLRTEIELRKLFDKNGFTVGWDVIERRLA